MAKEKKEKSEDEKPKSSPKDEDDGGKKKIIAIVVVIIVIIAVIAFIFLQNQGDGNGNGNGNGENHAPTAQIDLDQDVFFVNQVIYFNSTSSDVDGDAIIHEWDFGDDDDSTEVNATHEYTEAGTYNVTLTVTDDADDPMYDVATVSITVKEIPTVTFSVTKTQLPTRPPQYTVTIQAIDPSIDAAQVHFYVIDGATQNVLVDGNVASYITPPVNEYVNFYDVDDDGNISNNDNFVVTDEGSLSPVGIDDLDIFRLTMEESDDQIGEVELI